jgi:hypothetical protein
MLATFLGRNPLAQSTGATWLAKDGRAHPKAAINARSPSEPGSNIRATSHAAIAPSAELAARPIEDPESSRFINRLNHLSHTVDRARRAHGALHHKRARSRWTQWKAERILAEFTQQDANLVPRRWGAPPGPTRNYTLGATQHGDRGWPSSAFGARPPNPASSITLGISNRDLAISAQSALLALITPRSTSRGIDPSTSRTERNAVTLCSGEDKLTREDSKKRRVGPGSIRERDSRSRCTPIDRWPETSPRQPLSLEVTLASLSDFRRWHHGHFEGLEDRAESKGRVCREVSGEPLPSLLREARRHRGLSRDCRALPRHGPRVNSFDL